VLRVTAKPVPALHATGAGRVFVVALMVYIQTFRYFAVSIAVGVSVHAFVAPAGSTASAELIDDPVALLVLGSGEYPAPGGGIDDYAVRDSLRYLHILSVAPASIPNNHTSSLALQDEQISSTISMSPIMPTSRSW
jgi:hypothetical protein